MPVENGGRGFETSEILPLSRTKYKDGMGPGEIPGGRSFFGDVG